MPIYRPIRSISKVSARYAIVAFGKLQETIHTQSHAKGLHAYAKVRNNIKINKNYLLKDKGRISNGAKHN